MTRKPTKEEVVAVALDDIVTRLRALPNHDPEMEHSAADELLIEALRLLGAGHVADAWNDASHRVGFWYA